MIVWLCSSGGSVKIILDVASSLNELSPSIIETHYLAGLGLNELIPIGPKFIEEYRDFDVITDITYSFDVTEIYGMSASQTFLKSQSE